MNTLLVSENFPPRVGGTSRWFYEIYRRLPREHFAVAAGETAGQDEFDRARELEVTRVPLSFRSWGIGHPAGIRSYGRAASLIRRLVKTRRIAALHCGRCLPEGLIALLVSYVSRVRYLCYVHGEELEYAWGSRELAWLTRRVMQHAEILIANSQNTRQVLCDTWGLPRRRVRVLHPGVDTTRFVPAPRDVSVRGPLGWNDRTVILTAGRLQKRKGHDQMLRALGAIRKQIPDILYAIVGDGEERDALGAQVAHGGLADHVRFLGPQNDEGLVRCYQQCDLFVLPNRQVGNDLEGFGMVLLEAQACGRPVVAGASGGTAETMRIPETGRVVSCDETHALASVCIELLSDRPRLADMGRAAHEWIVERFDWSVLSREADRIFQVIPPDRGSSHRQS